MRKFTILIAEDELLLQRNIENKILALDLGFEIAGRAQNGIEALEIMEKTPCDVLISDIKMPQMDGLELIAQTRSRFADTVCVVVSGFAEFDYARQAMQLGVSDYLLKPLRPEELESTLTSVRNALQCKYGLSPEPEASSSQTAQLARRYINEHFCEELDLSSLACQLGFSAPYLTKIFAREHGVTPLKYLTELRVKKTMQLLQDTDLPIKAVGEAVGYPDQFYFSKLFKQSTGQSPAQFRKQTRN